MQVQHPPASALSSAFPPVNVPPKPSKGAIQGKTITALDKDKDPVDGYSMDPKLKWTIIALVIASAVFLIAAVIVSAAKSNPGLANAMRLDKLHAYRIGVLDSMLYIGSGACALMALVCYVVIDGLQKSRKAVKESGKQIEVLNMVNLDNSVGKLLQGLDFEKEIRERAMKTCVNVDLKLRRQKLDPCLKSIDDISKNFRHTFKQAYAATQDLTENIIIRLPEDKKIKLSSKAQGKEFREAEDNIISLIATFNTIENSIPEHYLRPLKELCLDFLFGENEFSLQPIEHALNGYRDKVAELNEIVIKLSANIDIYKRIVEPQLRASLA